jgi:hypothetical protein
MLHAFCRVHVSATHMRDMLAVNRRRHGIGGASGVVKAWGIATTEH